MTENNAENGDSLPWYDFQPEVYWDFNTPNFREQFPWVPNHVTHLRIGVQQALAAALEAAKEDDSSTGNEEDSSAESHWGSEIIDLPLSPYFGYQAHLKQVQIHAHSMQIIATATFERCNLEKVEFVGTTWQSGAAATSTASNPQLQSRLEGIEDWPFISCSNLHSVIDLEHVSCSLRYIGEYAFFECEKLATFDFSCLARLQYLGSFAFGLCESLTVVNLSNSVGLESISNNAFRECKALMIIQLPPKLSRICRKAFCHCDALVNIIIPETVEAMGYKAFWGCSSLKQVTFQSTKHLRRLMNNQQFLDCNALHALELQGPLNTQNLWPFLLEQLREDNGVLARAGIGNSTDQEDEVDDEDLRPLPETGGHCDDDDWMEEDYREEDEKSEEEKKEEAKEKTKKQHETKKQRITIVWNLMRANAANIL